MNFKKLMIRRAMHTSVLPYGYKYVIETRSKNFKLNNEVINIPYLCGTKLCLLRTTLNTKYYARMEPIQHSDRVILQCPADAKLEYMAEARNNAFLPVVTDWDLFVSFGDQIKHISTIFPPHLKNIEFRIR